MIRRGRPEHEEEESSSDEEDAFSALSRRGNNKRQKPNNSGNNDRTITPATTQNGSGGKEDSSKKQQQQQQPKQVLPISLTSSMKRHHKPNEVRKAKMDALLQELEAEKNSKAPTRKEQQQHYHRFVPDKKGSFVDPSEEHLTTNIFVGNLAPSITEEDMTDIFLQFGELYSVKIMWPRTPAEKSRNRNTGFVCFMEREDAEQAMDACSEKDPFNVGRQLMMRWGKNVKKNVRFGSGRMILPAVRQKTDQQQNTNISSSDVYKDAHDEYDETTGRSRSLPSMIQFGGRKEEAWDIAKAEPYQASIHSSEAIKVITPSDPNRFHFISTVASYVARDGSSLERFLIQSEAGNPLFNFLTLSNAEEHQREEYLFYRWRVYSFCQGDNYSEWRTTPFVMFHPQGRFWIPPPLNKEVAEAYNPMKRKLARQDNPDKRDFMTGRQFERALRKGNRRGHGGDTLTKKEFEQFDLLVRRKLSISRESICRAMAFCFEKSSAAKDIVALLKEALLDNSSSTSIDMRIARLYLISDILFNSQQPGVKNAFMYRDALEKMAPEIFTALGKHGGNRVGRMTMNKLRKAVSAVLGAWTEWSVYNPAFLDELQARFEGREIVEIPAMETEESKEEPKEDAKEEVEEIVIINQPRGGWTEVAEADGDKGQDEIAFPPTDRPNDFETEETGAKTLVASSRDNAIAQVGERAAANDDNDTEDIDGEPMQRGGDTDIEGEPMASNGADNDSEDIDGEAIDGAPGEGSGSGDMDGEPIDGVPMDGELIGGDIDGEPMPDDVDGEPIDGEPIEDDVDGEPIDGEPVEGDIDGKPIDGASMEDDVDGEPIETNSAGQENCRAQNDVDGEALDSNDDMNGDPMEDDVDGEPIE